MAHGVEIRVEGIVGKKASTNFDNKPKHTAQVLWMGGHLAVKCDSAEALASFPAEGSPVVCYLEATIKGEFQNETRIGKLLRFQAPGDNPGLRAPGATPPRS